MEVILASLGEMKFKILADEYGFYALYLRDDKINVSNKWLRSFFSASFASWRLSIKPMRY